MDGAGQFGDAQNDQFQGVMMGDLLTDPLGLLLLAIGALLGPALLIGAQNLTHKRARLAARLSPTGTGRDAATHKPPRLSWVQELGQVISPKGEKAHSAIRMRLMHAGYISKNAPYWYYGGRLIFMLGALGVLMALWPFIGDHLPIAGPMPAAIVVALIANIAPGFWLDRRQKILEQEYRNGFPDMMDLLVACVQAGLSLDAGIGRVSEEIGRRYPNLNIHLGIMSLELRAGRSRGEALMGFAERLGLDEARAFATMLRQSEEMGTSLSTTLRVFAVDMREKRMLYAEEKALSLPAKLVVPLIVFVFPSLLGVLMLPAGVRLSQVFSGMG
jgi:tight adherence protein C